jgi:hypothetical protein
MFEWLSNTINSAERSFLDFLGAVVPYFVPVIPAYLTFYHTRDLMNFPSWVAAVSAFVVEVLGITSVSTAIRFYRHNQKYKASQNKAPFLLAATVYVFYIVVVMTVNVLLEAYNGTRGAIIIWAIGLFSLLSFPSGVLVSIRSQYKEMLEEREEKRHGNQQAKPKEYKPKHASDYADKITAMLNAEYSKSGRVLSPKEITAQLKLDHDKSKGYVSTLTTKWKSEKGVGQITF